MADNLAVTPGTGATVKADQGSSSGALMQVVKLAYSADGDETLITADADGLEVQIGKSITLPTSPLAGQVWPVNDNGGALSVDDAAGSLTVDAPVGTPVFVRLSSGAAAVDALPVTDNGGALTVDGTVTANQGTPAAVANGWPAKITDGADTVGISTVSAAKALKVDVVQQADPPGTRVTKSVTLAASETGTTIWDPTAGKKFYITDVIIALVDGGRITLFDSTNAEANLVFDGELYGAPLHLNFQQRPWKSAAIDNILKATTDASAAGTITVHGYEV
jgi:phage baseplate assembly protein gpV